MSSEEAIHDLEQRYVNLRRDYEAVVVERDSCKSRATIAQQEADLLREQLFSTERKSSDSIVDSRHKDNLVEQLKANQAELEDRLRRRAEECDRLREDLKTQSNELIALQSRMKDVQIQNVDIQNAQVPIQLEVTKLSHERDFLQQQVQYLTTELQKKTEEERSLRTDSTQRIVTLERQVQDLQFDLEDKTKSLQTVREDLHTQAERADLYLKKSSEVESQLVQVQQSYSTEMEGVKRLTDLYKRHFEEATGKIEELEGQLSSLRELHQQKIVHFKHQLQQQLDSFQDNYVSKDKFDTLQSQYEQLTTQYQQLQQQAAQQSTVALFAPNTMEVVPAVRSEDFASMSMTEVYDRMLKMETDMLTERGRRKEVELYLQQILKDVEAKAPMIAKQRKDYQRIVQSHQELSHRLDQLAEESLHYQLQSKTLQQQTQELSQERDVLSMHNQDLSRQIQHLLKHGMTSRSTGGAGMPSGMLAIAEHAHVPHRIEEDETQDAQEVISSHLVLYNNVEELQKKNEELLLVIRRLSQEQTQNLAIENGSPNKSSSASSSTTSSEELLLKEVMLEFNALKEQQKQQESVTAVLLQQRDMYRAMLMSEDATSTSSPLKLQFPGASEQDTSVVSAAVVNQLQNQIRDLTKRLQETDDEKRRITDRVNRFETSEGILQESLNSLRKECSAVTLDMTTAKHESKFYQERVLRLEKELKHAQEEQQVSLNRKIDVEKSIFALQGEIRQLQDRVTQAQDEARHAKEALQRQVIEVEVSKQSETRVLQQLQSLKEEHQRQLTLTDSLHRIESVLQSRLSEENRVLQEERDSFKSTSEQIKKQYDDYVAVQESKLKVVEDDLRTLRMKYDVQQSEFHTIQTQCSQESVLNKQLVQEKNNLDKRVSQLQEKLFAKEGDRIVESVLEKETQEKEMRIQQLQNEVESLQLQLQAAKQHVESFRSLSAANETALKEIRERNATIETQAQQEGQARQQEVDRLQAELTEQREKLTNLLQEVETLRESNKNLQQSNSEAQRQHQQSLVDVQQENESMKLRLSTVQEEITKYETQAKTAFNNYEHELQLHAQAEQALRVEQENVRRLNKQVEEKQQEITSLNMTVLRLERLSAEEKGRLGEEKSGLQERVESLQRSNDLLHTQVQSMGVQLEKLYEQKTDKFTAGSEAPVEGESSASANATAASEEANNFDELTELRKSCSEMREVLRFLKREKEMLQARLTMSENENQRYLTQSQLLTRSLEESRAELKQILDKQSAAYSSEDFNKMQQELGQLALLRESNAYLRQENDDLRKKTSQQQEELGNLRQEQLPLNDRIRVLTAEKEALDLVNDQLTNDVTYWRNRLHTLVSRYNDVDPEEHRNLKVKLEEISKQLEEKDQQCAEKEKAIQDKLDEKTRLLAGSEQSASSLREKLRAFKQKNEQCEKKIAELSSVKDSADEGKDKTIADLQLKTASLTSQINDVNSKLESANKQIQSLQASLTAANEKKAESASSEAVPVSAPAAAAPAAAPVATPAATSAPSLVVPVGNPANKVGRNPFLKRTAVPAGAAGTTAAVPAVAPIPANPVVPAVAATPVVVTEVPAAVTAAVATAIPAEPTPITEAPASSSPINETETVAATVGATSPVRTVNESVAVEPFTTTEAEAPKSFVPPLPTTAPPTNTNDKTQLLKAQLMKKRPAPAAQAAAPAAESSSNVSEGSAAAPIVIDEDSVPEAKKARTEAPVVEVPVVNSNAMEMESTNEAPSLATESAVSATANDAPGVEVTNAPSMEEGEILPSDSIAPSAKAATPIKSNVPLKTPLSFLNNPSSFAAPSNTTAPSGGGLFGSASSIFGSGAFGAPSTNPNPPTTTTPSSIFGGAFKPNAGGAMGFGAMKPAEVKPEEGKPEEGAAAAPKMVFGSTFGGGNNSFSGSFLSQASAAPLFGASATTPTSSGSSLWGSAGNKPATSSVFSSGATPAAGSLFAGKSIFAQKSTESTTPSSTPSNVPNTASDAASMFETTSTTSLGQNPTPIVGLDLAKRKELRAQRFAQQASPPSNSKPKSANLPAVSEEPVQMDTQEEGEEME